MLAFEKVLEVFKDYLTADDVFEVLHNKRGYTVMVWDEKGEEWFAWNTAKLLSFCGMRCSVAFGTTQSKKSPSTGGR